MNVQNNQQMNMQDDLGIMAKLEKEVSVKANTWPEAIKVKVTFDFTGCEFDDILGWAVKDRTIAFQSSARGLTWEQAQTVLSKPLVVKASSAGASLVTAEDKLVQSLIANPEKVKELEAILAAAKQAQAASAEKPKKGKKN